MLFIRPGYGIHTATTNTANKQTTKQPNMTTFGVTSKNISVCTKAEFKKITKDKPNAPLDLHVWCEDEEGNVIYDPFFNEYYDIMEEHDCLGNTGSVHMPERFGRIYKKRDEWQPILKAIMKRSVKSLMADGISVSEAAYRMPQKYGCCFYNAYFWKLRNPEKNAKICVGQMGWKTTSGDEHWEYG
jgi:hypothetical protein